MSLLSTADIDGMRATLAESLPDTCVVQDEVFTDDGGGGGTAAWTPSGTVDCRIVAISGNEQLIADRLAEESMWVITVPAETTITTNSRIVNGSRTFDVTAMRAPRSWELSRRIEAREVR